MVCSAIVFCHVSLAGADVIWSFSNADASATPVEGFISIDVSSAAAGTTWTVADIVDYSFVYNGTEIASFAKPGLTAFFSDAAGINILEFTDDSPYLPFVSTSIGNFRSLLTNVTTTERVFLLENGTFFTCLPNIIPSSPLCNGHEVDVVALNWTATVEQVPEPPFVAMAGVSAWLLRRRVAKHQRH